MARPATAPIKLKDGFYIELRNQGGLKGIKLRRESIEQVLVAIKKYSKTYDVHYLGEFKKGKVINDKLPKESK